MIDGEGPQKECFKCHEALPLSEFYRHSQMGDGHLNKCKKCTRRDVQENYAARRPQYLAYERSRYGPERVRGIKASQERHPDRKQARLHVHVAVANGTLTRKPCEKCGDEKVDAHHEDYAKPLEVRWLCRKHHGEIHRMEKTF